MEGRSVRTLDRFSLQTIQMTTVHLRNVCGGSQCPRATAWAWAFRSLRWGCLLSFGCILFIYFQLSSVFTLAFPFPFSTFPLSFHSEDSCCYLHVYCLKLNTCSCLWYTCKNRHISVSSWICYKTAVLWVQKTGMFDYLPLNVRMLLQVIP